MKDIYRYGAEVNSHDLLKILAISTMVIDHIGKYLLTTSVWWRIVGRMAAPQFFFLVGYSGSYRFKRDIFAYGVALSVIHYLTNTSEGLFSQSLPLNILVSFTLIKLILDRVDPARLPTALLLPLLGILMLISLPTYFVIEYGTLGLCYAIGARLLHTRQRFGLLWICATVFMHFIFELSFLIDANPGMSMARLSLMTGLLFALFLTNLAIFVGYGMRTFQVRQRQVRTLMIYISRYSLEVYFFHLSAFMILAYVWNPGI